MQVKFNLNTLKNLMALRQLRLRTFLMRNFNICVLNMLECAVSSISGKCSKSSNFILVFSNDLILFSREIKKKYISQMDVNELVSMEINLVLFEIYWICSIFFSLESTMWPLPIIKIESLLNLKYWTPLKIKWKKKNSFLLSW